MKYLLPIVLALLALLAPELALAETVKPGNGTDWDLYVFGNAYVVKEVFEGIALLMTGEGSGFKTLLLFMATLGFLALAVGAGFDPGKNLLKMFTYILVAWFVSYTSTSLTANVVISDPVVDRTTDYRLTGIPAIVVLPAALTSQVGVTFTRFIETYFGGVVSPSFTISSGGQFNLFNRMIQETSQYTFRSPSLKKTISAYNTNCVIPAIVTGKFKGKDARGNELAGVEAMTKSANYVETLGSANLNAILTPYYFEDTPENRARITKAANSIAQLKGLSIDSSAIANGLLVPCSAAYEFMAVDMSTQADALLKASSEAWAKTGVQVPLENVYKDMLARAAVGQTDTRGSLSSPNGFILQQAALNTLNGSFREAAIQTGNSELLQASALAQAEQNQKSSWVAGFQVFNNMTGYVFTVLQVFIYALTPIIVVSMLIPGLGRTLVTNYLQILIWLTLWNPMLAIVNFILTLFGSEGFANAIKVDGLNYESKALASERASDLVIAAQFLGTMVPLLAWGIVKGAMAFTEFIQHGVGSSMAASAGAAAASGNLSMNNMGMDSVKMGDYSTRMSSAVGYQSVQAGVGAGALDVSHDLGGMGTKMNGSAVSVANQLSQSANEVISKARSVSDAASIAASTTHSLSDGISKLADTTKGSSENIAYSKAVADALNTVLAEKGISESKGVANAIVDTLNASTARNTQAGYNVEGGGSIGFGVGNLAKGSVGGKYSGGTNSSSGTGDTKTDSTTLSNNLQLALSKFHLTESQQETITNMVSNSINRSASTSDKADHSESALMSKSFSNVMSEMAQISRTASDTLSLTSSVSMNQGVDPVRLAAAEQQIESVRAQLTSSSSMLSDFQSMSDGMRQRESGFQTEFDAAQQRSRGQLSALTGQAGQYGGNATRPGNSVQQNAQKIRDTVAAADNAATQRENQGRELVKKQVRHNNDRNLQAGENVGSFRRK